MTAVQGYGWKLPDVLDGAVPGQAVVHVGNDAQIDAMSPGLFEHRMNQLPFARRGEEDFVDKQGARMMEKTIDRADNLLCRPLSAERFPENR